MSEITIQTMKNGPLVVKGNAKLLDADGKEVQTKEVYGLCRCGASSHQPFCDGSHQKVNFKG